MNYQCTTQEVDQHIDCLENERYVLKTAFESHQLVLARTELKPFQHTRGHRHSNEEIYTFYDDCLLNLDEEWFEIQANTIVLIPSNVFHQVLNNTSEVVRFNCFYAKGV